MAKWLKEGEVEAGDTVCLDNGFDCVKAGPVVIEGDTTHGLWFPHSQGSHFIDGQLDAGEYIGISAV